MKNKKLAMILTLIAAGSVFYGTSQAEAKGLFFDGIQITWTWGRHHHRELPPPPPPPPPHHHHYVAPPPPPPHYFHGRPHWEHRPGPRRDDFFRPGPPKDNRPPRR